MRPVRLPRRRIATGMTLVLAAAGLAFSPLVEGEESGFETIGAVDTAVPGSVQQVYTAMGRTEFELAALAGGPVDNTEIALPEGEELLTLQAVRVGREAAEPTLGVTSDGTAFFAAGTFDGVGVVVPRTEVLRSDDGGLTWESVTVELPGVRSEPPVTLDPMVYVDPVTDRVFNLELYVGCSYLITSDDDFETLDRNPAACGDIVNDHQTMVTGPVPPETPIQQSLYEDRWVYYCFNRVIDSNCGRSLDGGRTFVPTASPAFLGYDPEAAARVVEGLEPSPDGAEDAVTGVENGLCGGLHGHIETDPSGRLLLPKGHCGTPWLAVSEDGGDSWTRTQVSDMPAAGVHLSVAADAEDNLYMLWWDREHRLPWLSVSSDHGATWGEPRMIAPPGVREVNFPVITAGATGRIAINFPGTTSDDPEDDTRPWNQYVVVATDAHTDDAVFYSATGNDPFTDVLHRGDCNGRCGGLWDFTDVVYQPTNGEVWAAAADACVRRCDERPGPTKTVGDGIAIRQLAGPRLLVDTAIIVQDVVE